LCSFRNDLACFSSGSPATQSRGSRPDSRTDLKREESIVSNAGEVRNPSGDLTFSGGPDRAYNQFYGSMKTWGKYELVPNPTDADLIFEIGLVGVRDNPFYDQLRLVILDPKTHTILWTFVEHASAGGRQKSRDAAL
jgi:hypothetical protein